MTGFMGIKHIHLKQVGQEIHILVADRLIMQQISKLKNQEYVVSYQ